MKPPGGPRRLVTLAAAWICAATGLVAVTAAPAAAEPVSLTLFVVSVIEIDNPEDFLEACFGDYKIEVTIDGTQATSREFSIDPSFPDGCIMPPRPIIPTPFDVTQLVESTDDIIITIKVVDDDGIAGSDTMDVSPDAGDRTLRLRVVDALAGDLQRVDAAGNRVGAVLPGGQLTTIEGAGDSDRAGVNFFTGPDRDGDGLLDPWETGGLDADGDGTIDLDLPGWGASRDRKDLFVELDLANGQALTRGDIQSMKNAFAVAPLANPDGSTGVNLWVDTGLAVDPTAREGQLLGTCSDGIDNQLDGTIDGADNDCAGALSTTNVYLDSAVEDPRPANCTDGIDNDFDGLADVNDPDCLVGDNFGGGNTIAGTPAICNLNSAFYSAKRSNFNGLRSMVFRYAISTPGTSDCTSGGQAEIGGNDFVDHNGDGGTIMHELGHTLTLRHGGDENNNCKPNHVSVMSYYSQFGIGRVDGGVILDFAPVRRDLAGASRSNALTTSVLVENNLDETVALDPADVDNRFVFSNSTRTVVWSAISNPTNWDGDGNPNEVGVTANIDTADATSGSPRACSNGSTGGVHNGADEWNQVALPFRQFGDSADGAINASQPEPPLQEVIDLLDVLRTADLAALTVAQPDPVAAGRTVTVTADVTNLGSGWADATVVETGHDPRLMIDSAASPGCMSNGATATCGLGSLGPGDMDEISAAYDIPSDLVYEAGGPLTLGFTSSVDHVGSDPDSTNDDDVTEVTIVAVADVAVDSVTPTDRAPIMIIGQPSLLGVEMDVANDGPSSPIDGVLTVDVVASAGLSVSPPAPMVVSALAVDDRRSIETSVEWQCLQPGPQSVTVTSTLALLNAADSDPDSTNNAVSTTLDIECVVPIAFDVAPGDPANQVRLFSNGNVFAAVLTTGAGEYGLPLAFDATTVLPDSVIVGTSPDVIAGFGLGPRFDDHKDVAEHGPAERRRDRDLDLRLRFVTGDLPIDATDDELCVTGLFVSGSGNLRSFYGCTPVTPR